MNSYFLLRKAFWWLQVSITATSQTEYTAAGLTAGLDYRFQVKVGKLGKMGGLVGWHFCLIIGKGCFDFIEFPWFLHIFKNKTLVWHGMISQPLGILSFLRWNHWKKQTSVAGGVRSRRKRCLAHFDGDSRQMQPIFRVPPHKGSSL